MSEVLVELAEPTALSSACDMAGKHALAWAGAQKCLAITAAISALHRASRAKTEAKANEARKAALLGAALARAREAEARWREASGVATAAEGAPNAAALPALLATRVSAAAAACIALTEAEASARASLELSGERGGGRGGGGSDGADPVAKAGAALRATLSEHGDGSLAQQPPAAKQHKGGKRKQHPAGKQQPSALAAAEGALARWMAQHGKVVAAVVGEHLVPLTSFSLPFGLKLCSDDD